MLAFVRCETPLHPENLSIRIRKQRQRKVTGAVCKVCGQSNWQAKVPNFPRPELLLANNFPSVQQINYKNQEMGAMPETNEVKETNNEQNPQLSIDVNREGMMDTSKVESPVPFGSPISMGASSPSFPESSENEALPVTPRSTHDVLFEKENFILSASKLN